MCASLELIFFCLGKAEITKFQLPFQNSPEDIKSNVYRFPNLDEKIFCHNKDKAVFTLILYSDKKNFEFKFHIYKGENTVYIGKDYFFKKVYELIIFSENHKQYNITQMEQIFSKFDSLDNKYRKRLTLINVDSNIVFDGKNVDLESVIKNNYIQNENNDNNPKFYQISVQFDSNDKKFYIIKKIQENNDELNLKILKDNKQNLKEFMIDLETAINSQNFYMSINNLKSKHSDIFNIELPKLNKDIEYLTNIYKENELNDLSPFFICYFNNLILKSKILYSEDHVKAIFKRAKEEMKQLDLNTNITIVEKIKILSILFMIFKDIETKEELDLLYIKNIVISEKKSNSIIDKVCKFYDNFIDKLSEDSKIFFSILNLNSGTGYYHKKKVYTFDLTNINTVKKHLKSLFPKTLTIYNRYNTRGGRAFYSDLAGGIALNEIFLAPKKYYTLDYNSNNLNISENDANTIAMNIVLYIFHELGHKKFSYSNEGKNSPKKIVKNNRLIELKYENDFKNNDKNSEYILTTKANKGDSGHYLELCFNKFNNKNIFKLLISLKNKVNLIERPELFVDSLEKLENYVILKTIAEEKEISFQINEKGTIEDEINIMKEKIDIQKYLKEKEEERKEEEKKGKNKFPKKGKKLDLPIKKEYSFNYINKISNEEKENENEESDERKENEEEDEEEEEEDEEEEETEEEKKLKGILQKYGIKYDDEESLNFQKIINEANLSQEDYNFIYDLYIESLIRY